MCANGVACNGHGFQYGMRVPFQNGTVHERTRVPFVGVACHVLHRAFRSCRKGPLLTGREACAASASEAGILYALDNVLRSHLGEDLA